MEDVIDKLPVGTAPPELPPYLRGKRRRGNIIIMPDVYRSFMYTTTCHEDLYTLHFIWMARWNTDTNEYSVAHVNTRLYRQWLDTYDLTYLDGVPPHMSFGGRVGDGECDKETIKNWAEFVKKTFY